MTSSQMCPYCKKDKPEGEFPTRGAGSLKRRRACRECHLKRRRESWRKHDQKRNAERRKKWREDSAYRARNRQACQKYRVENGDHLRDKAREAARACRRQVIEKYGGECVCCGEEHWEFLAIDHIDSDGAEDRKKRGGAVALYRFLAKNPVQDGYQVLCSNCNTAVAFYGYCPHGGILDRIPVVKKRKST